MDLLQTIFRVVDILGVRVIGRQAGKAADQHSHGMRVFKEAIEELLHALVDGHVLANRASQLGQLIVAWKLAMQKKMHYLEKAALFGELFNRIPPVFENTLVTIDIGDRAFARSCI